MGCYSIGKDFLLWLLAVTSSEAKTPQRKMGLLSLGVYYISLSSSKQYFPSIGKDIFTFFSGFTYHNGKSFFVFYK